MADDNGGEWVVVATTADLAPGAMKAIEAKDRNIALYNVGGAFYAVENTDPSMKAQRLAEGISLSMYATVAGIAIFPVGAILFSISIWQVLRRPSR